MTNTKVLIISDSLKFIEYSNQLIMNSFDNVPIISIARRLIDSEKYFKEYLHNIVVIDIDTQNALLIKTIERFLEFSPDTFILCVESRINIQTMRSMFKAGIADYLSINEFDSKAIEFLLPTMPQIIGKKLPDDSTSELEYQLGLIRDQQKYNEKIINQHLKHIYLPSVTPKQLIFFRVDNISWLFHNTDIDRNRLKKDLEELITAYMKDQDHLFFSKKHSGFIVSDHLKVEDLRRMQETFKSSHNIKLSFIISKKAIIKDGFIEQYKEILQLLDSTFYLVDEIILDTEEDWIESQLLSNLPNNFAVDIQYRYVKREFLLSDYFILKSLDFFESNRVLKAEVMEFYSHLFQAIVHDLFSEEMESVLILKEVIRKIYLVNKFEDLKDCVININLAIQERIHFVEKEKLNPYIEQIYVYIEKNMSSRITLKKLSNHLGLTEIYISRLFKELEGVNLFTKINDLKMEHAGRLLEDEKYSISQAAQMVGFKDALYFSRVFKSHFGVSPSKYKYVRR